MQDSFRLPLLRCTLHPGAVPPRLTSYGRWVKPLSAGFLIWAGQTPDPGAALIRSVQAAEPTAVVPLTSTGADPRIEQLAAQIEAQRLLLALQQLMLAVRTHASYQRELELVYQLGGRKEPRLGPALETLAQRAATGVATVSELRDSFGVILLPKLQALQGGGAGPWIDRARTWLSNAIAPTPTNQPSEQDAVGQKLAMSAADRLAEDDLRGATELIGQLTGAYANLTARWLAEAKARMAAEVAHEALSGAILNALGRNP